MAYTRDPNGEFKEMVKRHPERAAFKAVCAEHGVGELVTDEIFKEYVQLRHAGYGAPVRQFVERKVARMKTEGHTFGPKRERVSYVRDPATGSYRAVR